MIRSTILIHLLYITISTKKSYTWHHHHHHQLFRICGGGDSGGGDSSVGLSDGREMIHLSGATI